MDWGRQLDQWLKNAQLRLLPPQCQLCGAPGQGALDLCSGCRDDLLPNHPACGRCGQPLPGGAQPLCGRCLRRPPPFERLFAPFRYAWPVNQLLPAFKFHGRLAPGRLLGELAAEAIAGLPGPRPELILPVPLHGDRLRERGYNQALELARPVARRLGVPLALDLCRRQRATAAQTDLTAPERRRNVKGAFVLTGPLPARHIALFDDVVSTGSTVTELARLLRRNGARRVEVWAVARAGR